MSKKPFSFTSLNPNFVQIKIKRENQIIFNSKVWLQAQESKFMALWLWTNVYTLLYQEEIMGSLQRPSSTHLVLGPPKKKYKLFYYYFLCNVHLPRNPPSLYGRLYYYSSGIGGGFMYHEKIIAFFRELKQAQKY